MRWSRKIMPARTPRGSSMSLSCLRANGDERRTRVSKRRTLPWAKSSTLSAAGVMRMRLISCAVMSSGLSMRSMSKFSFRYSLASPMNCMSRMRAMVWAMPCFLARMQLTMLTSSLAVTAMRMSAPRMSGSFMVMGLAPLAWMVRTSRVFFGPSSWAASWSTMTTSKDSLDRSSAMLYPSLPAPMTMTRMGSSPFFSFQYTFHKNERQAFFSLTPRPPFATLLVGILHD